jgi:acetyl-CoA carboxylase carboxyltransferase component
MEQSMANGLEELAARKAEARIAGGLQAIERHQAKGRMTARERIEYLFDEDSFQELDMLNRHVATAMGLGDNRPYGDGVITGLAPSMGEKFASTHRTSPSSVERLARRTVRRFKKLWTLQRRWDYR